MNNQLPLGAVVTVALSGLALALLPACSSHSGSGGTQSTISPQSPSDDSGDDIGALDAGADTFDPTMLTVSCGQSIEEWCCTYPGSVCWPRWTAATACLSPELSVTTMPPCGGFDAVRYDVDGGVIYTLYDASSGAFVAQGSEKGGTFGCFGGPTPFTILASCIPTWDAVPSAPCTAADAGDTEAGAPTVGPSTYCDGGAWSP